MADKSEVNAECGIRNSELSGDTFALDYFTFPLRGRWHADGMTDEVPFDKSSVPTTPHPPQAVPLPLKGKVKNLYQSGAGVPPSLLHYSLLLITLNSNLRARRARQIRISVLAQYNSSH